MCKHALLSASSAHRWIACTPSAKLEAMSIIANPELSKPSIYASEGILAHKYASDLLRHRDISYEVPNTVKRYISDYISYIYTISDSNLYIEETVIYNKYVQDGFGTLDCGIVKDDTLYIIDLKYGRGVQVLANSFEGLNPQLALYAIGLYDQIETNKRIKIEKIKGIIYQPRMKFISIYEVNLLSLFNHIEYISERAKLAYEGLGKKNPGSHCRFCKAEY